MIPSLYSAIKIHPWVSIISQTRKGSLTQLNAEMKKSYAEQTAALDVKAGLGTHPGEYEKLKLCHNLKRVEMRTKKDKKQQTVYQ